ncbi:hypothetical protein MTR_5g056650 [Medicago truncatula]|uniref:PB1-like domain-containing protein n=1 Tax=Medicago truncatula TaxID=3880 RepID=G7K1K7_MEDTR|nr:hypothetical protein MTR_5g056650 [Medicago truncatula]
MAAEDDDFDGPIDEMEGRFALVIHQVGGGGGGGVNEFHHAGYEGTHTVLECEPDYWSYFSLIATIKRLGYPMISQLWYYDPYMLYDLIRLKSDKGCRRMQAIAEMNGRVHLYVIYSVGCNAPISIKAIRHANNTFIQEIEITSYSKFKKQ